MVQDELWAGLGNPVISGPPLPQNDRILVGIWRGFGEVKNPTRPGSAGFYISIHNFRNKKQQWENGGLWAHLFFVFLHALYYCKLTSHSFFHQQSNLPQQKTGKGGFRAHRISCILLMSSSLRTIQFYTSRRTCHK